MIQSPLFMRCVSCSSEISDASRYCPACGRFVDSSNEATLVDDQPGSNGETIAPTTPGRTPSHPPSPVHRSSRTPSRSASLLSSSDALGGGRFTPGQIIADRYRVEYPLVTFALFLVIWLSIVLVLKRVGLLAIVVGLVVQNILAVFPMTSHLSRWYATAGLTGIFVILALTICGFFTALAGRRIFSGEALDK